MTEPVVLILNPWDSQGNQIAKASGGVYPTVRGCGGAGYQQGYLLDDRNGDKMWRGINGDTARTIDGHYYLGCGSRGGIERDVVYWVKDEDENSDGPCVNRTERRTD